MQINNILQINDWDIRKFLIVVLSMQFAVWGAVGLDALGINIPILRQVIVFIYLSFIPGYLILRILKLHELGNIETLLYAVGLSISFLMFSGVIINFIYPMLRLYEPISNLLLIISISIEILLLGIICYIRDRDFRRSSYISFENILSWPTLFLSMFPIVAIYGTYLMNFYDNNILLMLLIVSIALLVVLIGFDCCIPEKLYPYAIFVIALSLLFHSSLFSLYITGWDIQHEYYLANLVIKNSLWDYLIPYNTNGMLSIVMLAPIFSKLCGADLVWVFKIIYPLFFSLVPLGLYHVYKKQTNNKIAFFACFFFMSLFTFYTEMIALARQEIAELFLVLIILVILSEGLNKINKSTLFIIFAFSLFVSHYGLSYIFIFCLFGAWIMLALSNSSNKENTPNIINKQNKFININVVFICLVLAVTWYMYVSGSSSFVAVVNIGHQIVTNLTELFNPDVVQGLALVKTETTFLHQIAKIIHIATQFFIGVGILALIARKVKFNKEYAAFSLMHFLLLIACLIVPYFASALNTTRFYQISLIFLAPFCIIGFFAINKLLQIKNKKAFVKFLSVFLAIFLLFNSGFVYEITQDNPVYFYLNPEIDGAYFNQQEVIGAKWLFHNRNKKHLVYADSYRRQLCKSIDNYENITSNVKSLDSTSYVYLGTFNLKEKLIYVVKQDTQEHIAIEAIIADRGQIYDSKRVNIFK